MEKWVPGWVIEHMVGLSVAVSVIVAVAVAGVVVFDSGWLTDSGFSKESGSTTIRNLGFVVAGLVALPLAVWRARVADQQAKAADKQAETAQADLLNKRYQEGAAMLGSEVRAVRLAGIYALRRLAEDHPREYYTAVMSLLCAWVRHPGKEGAEAGRVREDVQAAVQAISSWRLRKLDLEEEARFQLDLCGADLRDASLGSANLSKAWLTDANMAGASVSRASLAGAMLLKANLSGTYLRDTDLRGADLRGADMTDAKLINADLWGAILVSAILVSADLTSANLSGTMFAGTMEAIGLTQEQLDHAISDPNKPPWLEGLKDPDTGEQLVPPRNPAGWDRYQRSKRKS